MKRIYYRYEIWEDFKNGMYGDKKDIFLVQSAINLLSGTEQLLQAMRSAVREWPKSAEMNLSNRSRNRQAWLGQAACSITFKVPENLTKEAWRSLDEETRTQANKIADQVIQEWEANYLKGKGD